MDPHSLAYIKLSKHLSDFKIVDKQNKLFESALLASQYTITSNWFEFENKTLWDIETQRLLIKCCRSFDCYPAYCYNGNLFELRTFSLRETDEQFKHLYHCSNVPPEIILNEGIKLRYSFSLTKGFPPLVFLSTDKRSWYGKYRYRVELHQRLYFDTNLNHKCVKGNDWFCVTQNIKPRHVSL